MVQHLFVLAKVHWTVNLRARLLLGGRNSGLPPAALVK